MRRKIKMDDYGERGVSQTEVLMAATTLTIRRQFVILQKLKLHWTFRSNWINTDSAECLIYCLYSYIHILYHPFCRGQETSQLALFSIFFMLMVLYLHIMLFLLLHIQHIGDELPHFFPSFCALQEAML